MCPANAATTITVGSQTNWRTHVFGDRRTGQHTERRRRQQRDRDDVGEEQCAEDVPRQRKSSTAATANQQCPPTTSAVEPLTMSKLAPV